MAGNDKLVSLPAAKYYDLDGADYKSGMLSITSTVSVPVPEAIGKDASTILAKLAAMDDDDVITKDEAKELGLAVALAVAKHYGLGKLLS